MKASLIAPLRSQVNYSYTLFVFYLSEEQSFYGIIHTTRIGQGLSNHMCDINE